MPPPPGVPDWVYPGMLLIPRSHAPDRYIIQSVELDAEGDFRINLQQIQVMYNGEYGINNRGDTWPVGGAWFDAEGLVLRFEPLGYHNPISPFPRFRQTPRERVHSPLRDALQMFGGALNSIGGQFIAGEDLEIRWQAAKPVAPITEKPNLHPARTLFERILDEDEED